MSLAVSVRFPSFGSEKHIQYKYVQGIQKNAYGGWSEQSPLLLFWAWSNDISWLPRKTFGLSLRFISEKMNTDHTQEITSLGKYQFSSLFTPDIFYFFQITVGGLMVSHQLKFQ